MNGRISHYIVFPEGRMARMNVFALTLALNQLLYAPTLALFIGREGWLSWPLALFALPFALTPAIMRKSDLIGRLWVPFIGIGNTLAAQIVLGYDCNGWVFLLPSLSLAALVLGKDERIWLVALTLCAMAVLLLAPDREVFSPATAQSIFRLNAGSAVILTGFIGCLFPGRRTD